MGNPVCIVPVAIYKCCCGGRRGKVEERGLNDISRARCLLYSLIDLLFIYLSVFYIIVYSGWPEAVG